ncbi:U32 family peptidase [Bianquea renquensis]|uniref:U32 family peptidase n=1 Tax=Bianquea renquensis TaxID=2763661 RepID=A0A926DVK8_9FIRM|nr:U32 family peptidase [Bianquea renquensis]MBC8544050.1 U32 family peptidase [Bianquea renquensis]
MNREWLPELLSPAGDMDCLKAAVDAGCDAVYLGGSQFNARQGAGNFSAEEMEAAVRYCTLRGVKAYLTLNTLIKEREWEQLAAFVAEIAGMGFSGVILQDLGVAMYLRRHFPMLELHASTQMSVHDQAGVEFLNTQGFQRVVLAREMTLDEIRTLRAQTSTELEVFIHGALCYCYSGRCLMSSLIGGRSGNRGRCAQPCRLPYGYVDVQKNEIEEPAYRLNLKDMCSLDFVGDLVASGVHSLKIEGRLKSPAYVAGVTELYRRALDYCGEHHRSYVVTAGDRERLQQLYNRGGFSKGYYFGKEGMIDLENPKHSGLLVGTVAKVRGREGLCQIMPLRPLHPGDVIEIRTKKPPYPSYQLRPENVSEVGACCIPLKAGVEKDQQVFRLTDAQLLHALREKKTSRRLGVSMRAVLKKGIPMELTVTLRQLTITVWGAAPAKAEKQPITEDDVHRSLSKLGDTAFYLDGMSVEMDSDVFVPVAVLNQLRRDAVEKLESQLTARKTLSLEATVKPVAVRTSPEAHPPFLEIEFSRVEQFRAIPPECIPWIRRIFPRMERVMPEAAAEMLAWGQTNQVEICPVLPAVSQQRNRDAMRTLLRRWMDVCVQGYAVCHVGQVNLILDRNQPLHLNLGFGILNKEHACFWQRQGAVSFLLSPELNLRELRDLGRPEGASALVYGHIPIMVTEQCPGRDASGCRAETGAGTVSAYLKDRKGAQLPVERHCRFCYSTIYSSEPIWLGDKPEVLRHLPVDGLRMFFLEEAPEEVSRTLTAYAHALEGKAAHNGPSSYTRGHFFRGVE